MALTSIMYENGIGKIPHWIGNQIIDSAGIHRSNTFFR